MGCGCGKGGGNKASAKGYVLIAPDGTKTEFATESEAKVANRKLSGKGLVRPIR